MNLSLFKTSEGIVALVLILAGTWLAVNGDLPKERWDEWVDFTKWVGSAFILSRGLTKYATKREDE